MNLRKSFQSGFTLIELLVVVAIIGILASIVLASLNTARNKGSDAAVKANLANMRAQAAIFYETNTNYGISSATAGATSCTAPGAFFSTILTTGPVDPTILGQISAAQSAGGGLSSCMNTTGINGSWAAAVNLKSDTTQFWCVDSNGTSKVSTFGTPANTQPYANSVVAGGKCN